MEAAGENDGQRDALSTWRVEQPWWKVDKEVRSPRQALLLHNLCRVVVRDPVDQRW